MFSVSQLQALETAFWLPALILAIFTWLNLIVCFSIQAVHFLTILKPARRARPQGSTPSRPLPFISVHVPAYNEPAEIVINTLSALSRVEYPNFEVLLLDNNTPDPKTYEPVRAACEALGPRFRFHHFDGVKGAKAGALNIGLTLCAPRTEYVAIVDADYAVTPDFLGLAAQHLADSKISFVQFPQAYRCVDAAASAVEDELADYFHAFVPRASEDHSVLLTGTLSVLRLDHLRQAGGWSGATVTEDAELGVRMFLEGMSGVFVPKAVGHGLLPLSLSCLKAQRKRWVAGNVQTIFSAIKPILALKTKAGSFSLLAQLSAWPSFWLLPAIVLLATAPLAGRSPDLAGVQLLASITILGSATAVALRLSLNAGIRRQSPGRVASALLVKLALVWSSSTGFLPAVLRHAIPFVRTAKSVQGLRATSRHEVLLALPALVALAFYLSSHAFLPALACVLMVATIPAGWWVDQSLREYSGKLSSA